MRRKVDHEERKKKIVQESLRLFGRADAALSAAVSPADAIDLVYWESSDPGVARVDAQGVVSGQKPGTAVVTAYGAAGTPAAAWRSPTCPWRRWRRPRNPSA